MKYHNIFQKNILEKKDELLNIIKNAYGENLEALVLFGSLTRADFSVYSDIDLFIIINESNLSLRQRVDEFYEKVGYYFEDHFLSPIILTLENSLKFHPFYLGIFDSYIVLYDKSKIVAKIIGTLKQKIEKGEIKEEAYPKKHWRILSAEI